MVNWNLCRKYLSSHDEVVNYSLAAEISHLNPTSVLPNILLQMVKLLIEGRAFANAF